MKRFSSIYRQTKDFPEHHLLYGQGRLWMFTDFPMSPNGEQRYVFTEYDENCYPVTGIFTCVVTKQELDEFFEYVKEHIYKDEYYEKETE